METPGRTPAAWALIAQRRSWTMHLLAWIEEHVLVPTVHTMKRNRKPFRGVLYAGLMLTPHVGSQSAGVQLSLSATRNASRY